MTGDKQDVFTTPTTQKLALSRNVVIFASAAQSSQSLEEIVQLVGELFPARIFLLLTSESGKEFSVSSSLRCHRVGDLTTVCSEVLRIEVPANQFDRVPSVLSARCITGIPVDLYIVDPNVRKEFLPFILSFADQVVFDSPVITARSDLFERVLRGNARLVDFAWLRLGTWRRELKNAFDRPQLLGLLTGLQRIEIQYQSASSTGSLPIEVALIMGWLIERLDLEMKKVLPGEIQAAWRTQQSIGLRVEPRPGFKEVALERMRFVFAHGAGDAELTLKLAGPALLEAELSSVKGTEYRSSVDLPDQSSLECLRTFIAIGESVISYRSSLRRALDVTRMLDEASSRKVAL